MNIDLLCAEHEEINARLASLADGDLAGVVRPDALLRRHIDMEENGVNGHFVVPAGGQ